MASREIDCAAPVVSSASFQRSRKRCCWRCTAAGTSGSACGQLAQVLDALEQHGHQPLAFVRPRRRQAFDGAPGGVEHRFGRSSLRAAPRHHCIASCTDSGAGLGSQLAHPALDPRRGG